MSVENRGSSRLRFTTRGGTVVLAEPSHTLPIVDVTAILRIGSLADPIGQDGLARLAARLVRMGPLGRTAEETDEALEALGATLAVDVSHGTIRLTGAVIARSFPAYLALLGEILTRPALRDADLARVRREAVAEIGQQRDNDRWLASRAFRSLLFGEHPYARSPLGTVESLRRIRRDDVRRFAAAMRTAPGLVLGIAGDVDPAGLPGLVEQAFGGLPRRRLPTVALPPPRPTRGRRIVVVDKPGRTQTQMFLGTLGSRLRDPDFHTLLVANTAFGGTFSAPLVQEVRARRGWSYSASSRLGADREREAWSLYTHPSAENAAACLALELELVERFVADGPKARELAFAKSYLVKSHAFDLDTPSKRLEPRLEAEVHGLPDAFHEKFVDRVRGVTVPAAREAVRRRLSATDLTIALVATASDVKPALESIPGAEIRVVSYERV